MNVVKEDEFQCHHCKRIYKKGWSYEEKMAEYKANFPIMSKKVQPLITLCERCYAEIITDLQLEDFYNRGPSKLTDFKESKNGQNI